MQVGPDEGVGPFRAGVTGHCKWPGVGVGDQTRSLKEQKAFF